MSAISVFVVDDEELLREMLIARLSAHPEIEVVGESSTGEAAVEMAGEIEPDVVLMDIELGPGINGIQAGKTIKRQAPATGIVLLSAHVEKEILASITTEEVSGWSYLLKKNVRDTDTLVRAIKGASWGIVVIDLQLTEELRPRLDTPLANLSEDQIKLLELVAQGYPDAAIASKLKVPGEGEVQDRLVAVYGALGIPSDIGIEPRVKAVVVYLEQTRSR